MSNAKDLRKQIKNVLQAEGTALLTEEVAKQLEARIMAYVKERLDKIDERQKEITSFMVRSASKG